MKIIPFAPKTKDKEEKRDTSTTQDDLCQIQNFERERICDREFQN